MLCFERSDTMNEMQFVSKNCPLSKSDTLKEMLIFTRMLVTKKRFLDINRRAVSKRYKTVTEAEREWDRVWMWMCFECLCMYERLTKEKEENMSVYLWDIWNCTGMLASWNFCRLYAAGILTCRYFSLVQTLRLKKIRDKDTTGKKIKKMFSGGTRSRPKRWISRALKLYTPIYVYGNIHVHMHAALSTTIMW